MFHRASSRNSRVLTSRHIVRNSFVDTPHVFREGNVAFHHEAPVRVVQDHCVLHLEMAGEFAIPPARAELMYQTERYGHSGAFTLEVK